MYSKMTIKELKQFCRDNNIKGYSGKKKADIIKLIKNPKKKQKMVKIPKAPDFGPYIEVPSGPDFGSGKRKMKGGLSKVPPKMGKGALSDIYNVVNKHPMGNQLIKSLKNKYNL